MQAINAQVKFFVDLAKIQAIMSRRFDSGLGGLGFNEFIVLFHLSQAEKEKMRRIDLAEKIGLTASGVTRILLPMEKVGLVKKETNKDDARSSLVMLAPGGRKKLEEGVERAELLVGDIIPAESKTTLKELAKFVADFSRAIR
jgi:DNA-binding MarR family transcriptional regulator